MLLATWTDEQFHHDRVDYWSEVYGFKMDPMKEGVIREPKIDFLPETAVSSNAHLLKVCFSFKNVSSVHLLPVYI